MNMTMRHPSLLSGLAVAALGVLALVRGVTGVVAQEPFRIEEANIASIHDAIAAGRATCHDIVQAYVDRAKAYNGIGNVLVTEDGAAIPAPLSRQCG